MVIKIDYYFCWTIPYIKSIIYQSQTVTKYIVVVAVAHNCSLCVVIIIYTRLSYTLYVYMSSYTLKCDIENCSTDFPF